jgi:starch-binding outer membrane protein, SusD/RagB family
MKRNIILLFLFSTAFVGCDKKLDITSQKQERTETYWQTAEQASAAVIAIYNSLIQDGTYMRMMPALTDGRGDDFTGDSPWGDLVQTGQFTVLSTSGPVQWVWAQWYQLIYRTNQVLTNVPAIEMEQALKDRLLGQAHFLRGLAYFTLANTYKAVPLILTPPVESSEYYEPTASEEVLWQQIISDLTAAKELLPVSYAGVSGPDANQIGRVTKGAAVGILGKVYLYRKNWTAAAEQFKLLIDGPELNIYSLMSNYRDNFKPTNENNAESLFEVQFADPDAVGGTVFNYGGEPNANWKQVSSVGHTYAMDGFGYSDFLPTRGIYSAFKEEKTVDGQLDPRLLSTIASYEPGVSELAYGAAWKNPKANIYPRKYTHDGIPGYTNENNGVENSGINYRVLRYADVLLMYAEALNELGQTTQAYSYIQQVRSRAKLPNLATAKPNMSQEQMRDQIAHERYLELAIEGIRINDIIRWGWLYNPEKLEILKEHDNDFNTWRPGKEYLPIPQRELDLNKNLLTNPAN